MMLFKRRRDPDDISCEEPLDDLDKQRLWTLLRRLQLHISSDSETYAAAVLLRDYLLGDTTTTISDYYPRRYE